MSKIFLKVKTHLLCRMGNYTTWEVRFYGKSGRYRAELT